MKPLYHLLNCTDRLPDALLLNLGLSDLTPCEWKILLNIGDDLTTAEIAEKHCLLPKSVENYRTRIGDKLALKGRHKLAKFARRHAGELHQWHDLQLLRLPPREK